LPDASFAGLQDTYLNVKGEDALIEAVLACWASLWNVRALSYRLRQQIDSAAASMAVIVQELVPSETSGVLFTANPLSGLRSESVIDATLGLGKHSSAGSSNPTITSSIKTAVP
jgi:pyruvate,water dikinase